jgi:hypothetical protein
MATPKLTILLSGMIAGVPHQGGATWAVLQYLLGFKRLGHNVHFVEPVEEAALRPAGVPLARSENAAYFQRTGTKGSVRSAGESDTRRRGDRALLVHERGTPEPGSGVVDTSFASSVEPRRRKALERRSVKTWTTRSAKEYLLLDDRVYSLVV